MLIFRSTPGDMPATSGRFRLSPWTCFFNTCTSIWRRLVASLDSLIRFLIDSSADTISACGAASISRPIDVIVAVVAVETIEATDTFRGVFEADRSC